MAIQPTITTTPNPPCEGGTCVVEISGMPEEGSWSVTIKYQDGTRQFETFADQSSGEVHTTPPSGTAGTRMTVIVTMGPDTASESFLVEAC